MNVIRANTKINKTDLICLKEVVNRLSDENDELRRGTGKRPPELRKLGVANFDFDGEKGPCCQPCHDTKQVRTVLTEPEAWNGGTRRHCLVCGGYFYEQPPQRAGMRPMGRRGPYSLMEYKPASSDSVSMPRRGRLDLAKIQASLAVTCPHCGASIEPNELQRVDWDHIECPKCGETFIPAVN